MKTSKYGIAASALGLVLTTSAFATGDLPTFEATSLSKDDGAPSIKLTRLSTFEGEIQDEEVTEDDKEFCAGNGGGDVDEVSVQGGAEIVAYDRDTRSLFITHDEVRQVQCEEEDIEGNDIESEEQVFRGVDIVNIRFPRFPFLIKRVDTSEFGKPPNLITGRPTSVAVCRGRQFFAVAIAADPLFDSNPKKLKTINGVVQFYNKETGRYINEVEVGSLPDMITCTPDGNTLLVANEGEPERNEYDPDPEGSVSIVDVSRGVRKAKVFTAGFRDFNRDIDELVAAGVRIYGPNATVAQDLEPEYIAVSADSAYAFITLQENNAIAKLDINAREITDIIPLGYKDHSLVLAPDSENNDTGMAISNGLDPSNDDGSDGAGGITIQPWPVFGMYQPDAIASFVANDQTYLVTANEGDSRDYDAFTEQFRVRDLTLCEDAGFPENIQENNQLGRLKITSFPPFGFDEENNCFNDLYAYGGRSLTIWDSEGTQIYDTGDDIEQITAITFPNNFNSEDNRDSFDERSDDQGPEPEGVTTGVVDGQTYAFGVLERIGGIIVYNVSNPEAPKFVQYINNRDFAGNGDLAPEGIVFISAEDAPGSFPLIAVAHEESGTTTLYLITLTNLFFR